jgi:hypothetical protein
MIQKLLNSLPVKFWIICTVMYWLLWLAVFRNYAPWYFAAIIYVLGAGLTFVFIYLIGKLIK